jgi:hypothetical protein
MAKAPEDSRQIDLVHARRFGDVAELNRLVEVLRDEGLRARQAEWGAWTALGQRFAPGARQKLEQEALDRDRRLLVQLMQLALHAQRQDSQFAACELTHALEEMRPETQSIQPLRIDFDFEDSRSLAAGDALAAQIRGEQGEAALGVLALVTAKVVHDLAGQHDQDAGSAVARELAALSRRKDPLVE